MENGGLQRLLYYYGNGKLTASQEYVTYIIDQLRDFGPVTSKRMFGGAALYIHDVFFAFIDDDILTFKADKSTWADFEAAGVASFSQSGPKSSIRFYEVPAEVLEDREKFCLRAKKAVEVSKRHKGKK